MARRDRKLAAECVANPEVAYRRILSRKKTIVNFEVETAEHLAKRRSRLLEELEALEEDFKKNFPWAGREAQEALKKRIEESSSANR